MSQITINDVILMFKDSSFTGDQWEQVASWVLNGGGEAAAESARIALNKAAEAVNAATNAKRDANRSESYAVGGTGTRDGEDTDNAKYYCQQAHAIAGEGMVFSVNGQQADEVGNVALTKANIGLDKVDNTSDADKPVSTAQQAALDALTYTDVDAAPAGYGLGEETSPFASDVNQMLNNGYFCVTSASANYPMTHGAGHVKNYSKTEAVQVITSTVNGHEIRRRTTDGGATWVEEWISPPMFIGVEYRTTERYKGKPVYRKIIEYTNTETVGTAGTLTTMNIRHGISDFDECAMVFGKIGNYIMPYYTLSGYFAAVVDLDDQYVRIRTNAQWTSRTWYFEIKHTKTTD